MVSSATHMAQQQFFKLLGTFPFSQLCSFMSCKTGCSTFQTAVMSVCKDVWQPRRHFFSQSSIQPTPHQCADRISRLETTILASNWADHVNIFQNIAFWESELCCLEEQATAIKHPDIHIKLKELQDLMDCLHRATDVRDYIIEVIQYVSHFNNIPDTEIFTADKKELLEHCNYMAQTYDTLLESYPGLGPKIEETVGQGLGLLRQNCRFEFSSQHQYFF